MGDYKFKELNYDVYRSNVVPELSVGPIIGWVELVRDEFATADAVLYPTQPGAIIYDSGWHGGARVVESRDGFDAYDETDRAMRRLIEGYVAAVERGSSYARARDYAERWARIFFPDFGIEWESEDWDLEVGIPYRKDCKESREFAKWSAERIAAHDMFHVRVVLGEVSRFSDDVSELETIYYISGMVVDPDDVDTDWGFQEYAADAVKEAARRVKDLLNTAA